MSWKIKHYIDELRLPFTSASMIPIIVGTCYAYASTGNINLPNFLLALFSIVFLHLSANVLNDYFDVEADSINVNFVRPFTGGSRLIQLGILSPKEVFIEGLVLLVAGCILGLCLVAIAGLPVLWLGLAGVFLGVAHSAPPLKLHGRSLGEFDVALAFGILPVLGAFYVQTSELNLSAVLVSIPVASLIAAVLFVNGFQDRDSDQKAGKITLTVRLGKFAPYFLIVLVALPYVAVAVFVAVKILGLASISVFLTLPLAYRGLKYCLLYHSEPRKMVPSNASIILLHLVFGVIYSITIVIFT